MGWNKWFLCDLLISLPDYDLISIDRRCAQGTTDLTGRSLTATIVDHFSTAFDEEGIWGASRVGSSLETDQGAVSRYPPQSVSAIRRAMDSVFFTCFPAIARQKRKMSVAREPFE